MRIRVQSLASLSRLRIWCCCKLECRLRCGSDPVLPWLWCRPQLQLQFSPQLEGFLPYAADVVIKKKSRKHDFLENFKKKKKLIYRLRPHSKPLKSVFLAEGHLVLTNFMWFFYFQIWGLLSVLSVSRSFDMSSLAKSDFFFPPETTAPSSALQKVVGKASMYYRGWRCTWGPTMGRSPLCAPSLAVGSSSLQQETWRTTCASTQVCAPPAFPQLAPCLAQHLRAILRKGSEMGLEMKDGVVAITLKIGFLFF